MIYSLRGELVHTEQGLAVVECGGVGYACRTTANTIRQLNKSGEVKLFTYMHFTENSADLFGFADTSELACFKQLISVSGVGPKAALSILSDITPSKLALCITTGDSKTLTKSPGIGAKIAQRIVLELKDKIAKEQHISSADLADIPSASIGGSNVNEALTALAVLGFNPAQAQASLSGADPNSSVEDLIKYGLKRLGN
jgi:Holliday junction DNA helicase RuvA